MPEENNVQPTSVAAEMRAAGQGAAEQNTMERSTAEKPRSGGSILERRFRLYDKIKISVKALDIIIAVAVVLLLVFFILGIYKR